MERSLPLRRHRLENPEAVRSQLGHERYIIGIGGESPFCLIIPIDIQVGSSFDERGVSELLARIGEVVVLDGHFEAGRRGVSEQLAVLLLDGLDEQFELLHFGVGGKLDRLVPRKSLIMK